MTGPRTVRDDPIRPTINERFFETERKKTYDERNCEKEILFIFTHLGEKKQDDDYKTFFLSKRKTTSSKTRVAETPERIFKKA